MSRPKAKWLDRPCQRCGKIMVRAQAAKIYCEACLEARKLRACFGLIERLIAMPLGDLAREDDYGEPDPWTAAAERMQRKYLGAQYCRHGREVWNRCRA